MSPKFRSDSRLTNYTVALFGVFLAALFATLGALAILEVRSKSLLDDAAVREKTRARELATRLEAHLNIARQLAETTAAILAPLRNDRGQVEKLLAQILQSAPQETIYGIGVWFEPYAFTNSDRLFGPYVRRTLSAAPTLTYEWSAESYNYPTQKWYLSGKLSGGNPTFTKPYFDTDLVYMSIAKAFFTERKKFAGVVTVDMTLPLLREMVNRANIYPGEAIFVTTNDGSLFVHPREAALLEFAQQEGVNAKSILDLNLAFLKRFERQHAFPKSVEFTVPVRHADWVVRVAVQEEFLYEDAIELRQQFMLAGLLLWLITLATMFILYRAGRQKKHTEDLQAEIAARKAAEEELERRVEARTIELKEAMDRADRANRAKSEFLTSMSHELRTPLNGILGYAQILRKGSNLTQEQVKGLEVVYQCGDHLLMLINDILDLSKIEAQKLELHHEVFHFHQFLRELTDLMAMQADRKGISFLYEPLSVLPEEIYADKKRLRQILINLLSNAIKFTDRGGVVLKVGKLADRPNNSALIVRFEVADTGLGIAPQHLEKIFGSFEQVGDRQHKTEGTGLGLAISQKLAHMMDSDIQVSSELGKGSVFWFDLQLTVIESQSLLQDIVTKQVVGYRGRQRSILIVDDSWSNRAVFASLLAPLGFHLCEGKDGEEGWLKALEHLPDAAIVDVLMPNMDGLTLIQKFREHPSTAQMVLIASSASIFHKDKKQLEGLGIHDFLTKPFREEDLLEKLQVHLHLEWNFGDAKVGFLSPETETLATVYPPSSEITRLLDMALRGNLRGLMREIARIERMDGKFATFANHLRRLAQSFQIDEIEQILLSHSQQETGY